MRPIENPIDEALERLRTVVLMIAAGVGVVLGVIVRRALRGDLPAEFGLPLYLIAAWVGLLVLGRPLLMRQVEADGRRRIAARTFEPSRASRLARFVEEQGDGGRLFCVFQTRCTLGAVLLQMAALFAALSCLLGAVWTGAGTAALLWLLILAELPTRSRWEAWRARQRELLRPEA